MSGAHRPGDLVKLKSGGQKLLVTKAADKDGMPHVWCTWIDKSGKQESGDFPASAVVTVNETKEPPPVNRGPPGGEWVRKRRG
jgi:uncharacterized protein YodC (DUF2158 family)